MKSAFTPRILVGCLLLGCGTPLLAQTTSTQPYVIDLPTALKLAKAQNLDVQIARTRLEEAKANHGSAMAKFLPWLSAGFSWRRHEGRTQAVDGTLIDTDKQSMSFGPTITAQVDLGDAIYTTLAAKQIITAADAALMTQQQDSTLAAASAYFDLLKAQALVEVQQQALQASDTYQQQINSGVSAGVVFKGDALRVQTQTERYRLSLTQAEQQQALQATRLAQLLHLDPSVALVPQDKDLVPIELVKQDNAVEQLLPQALSASPEIKQSQALAEAARKNKSNTVYGPLIPSIGAQAFLGEFGGGRDSTGGNYGSSKDYALGLSWRIGPGGLFDFTRIKASNARLNAAELTVEKTTDSIKRQLIDAHTRLQSFKQQLDSSRNNVSAATETLRLTRERKQLGVGIVLEDIQAQQEVARAQAEYLGVITDYNKAQYELSKLLGSL
jgi:outer membrane protein TolC